MSTCPKCGKRINQRANREKRKGIWVHKYCIKEETGDSRNLVDDSLKSREEVQEKPSDSGNHIPREPHSLPRGRKRWRILSKEERNAR